MPGEATGAPFVVLEWDGEQLMLRTVASLASELPMFAPDQSPDPSGTVCFFSLHPDTFLHRLKPEQLVKGPERTRYGMMELNVRNPDGYVICLGSTTTHACAETKAGRNALPMLSRCT